MTHSIIISEDTTLSEEHSGMRILVDAVATITLPHETTYKFIEDDEFEIISYVDGNVKIEGEKNIEGHEDVEVIPMSNALITSKGASVKIQYQGDNVYLMWGNV